MRKFQQDNPNNARVRIDFSNKECPVEFEYVGTETPFRVVYKFYKRIFVYGYLLVIVFVWGLFIGISALNPLGFFYYYSIFIEVFVIYYGTPFLLALLFTKTRLVKKIPYLQSAYKPHFFATFEAKDLKDNQLEIPLYNNVFLFYQMTGDFSTHKSRIDIIEHPFNMITKKQGFFKTKRELRRNEYYWKATFTFKEGIKEGQLLVEFY